MTCRFRRMRDVAGLKGARSVFWSGELGAGSTGPRSYRATSHFFHVSPFTSGSGGRSATQPATAVRAGSPPLDDRDAVARWRLWIAAHGWCRLVGHSVVDWS